MRTVRVPASVRLASLVQGLVLVALLLLVNPLARASTTTLYWDPLLHKTSASDGNANWDTTTTDWSNLGAADVAWGVGDDASIGTATGSTKYKIGVKTAIEVGDITFNAMAANGVYTISGTAVTVKMDGDSAINGGAPTIIQNNSAAVVPIGTSLTLDCGNLTFTKDGMGQLQFSSSHLTTTASISVEVKEGTLSEKAVDNLIPTNRVLQLDYVGTGTNTAVFDINGQNQIVSGLTSVTGGNTVAPQLNNGGTASTTFTITNSGSSYTYGGKISGGNMNLTLMGAVTENLTGTSYNSVGGVTTVSNTATLNVMTGGSFSNSVFQVYNGATLGVTLAAADGVWVCSNLTFNSGSTTLNLNYGGFGTTTPSGTGSAAPVNAMGATNALGVLVANGTTTINVSGIAAGSIAPHTAYPLIAYSGTAPSASAFVLGFTQGGITGHILVGAGTGADAGLGSAGVVSMVIDTYCTATITLAPASLDAATAGASYSGATAVTASGDGTSYTFAFGSGTTPPGITLNANGTWSGSCTVAGTYNFSIVATETSDAGGCTGVNAYSLTVKPATLAKYSVTATSPQTQYVQFPVVVTAQDTYGNTVSTNAVITLTHAGGLVFPAGNTLTLTNGVAAVIAQDSTAPDTATATATDTHANTGTSASLSITAAGTLVFDPSSTPATGSDASGNWDNVTGNWANTPTPADQTWAANDLAVFGTSAGFTKYAVKLAGNISVGSITFNQESGGNYALASVATVTLSSGLITDNNTSSTDTTIPGVGADRFGHGATLECGAVTFTKDGNGTFQFSSQAIVNSTAAVGIEVKNGMLQLAPNTTANVLPAGILQVDNSDNSQPTFDDGGYNLSFAGLQSGRTGATNGLVRNSTPNFTSLTFTGNGTYTFAGTIAGSNSVTLTGTGTEILTGTNTYYGSTVVSNGTLLVNGVLGATTNTVSVYGGTFGGIGTVNGAVTWATGAQAAFTITPNNGTNATPLTVASNAVFNSTVLNVTAPSGLGSGTYVLVASSTPPATNGTPTVSFASGSLAAGHSTLLYLDTVNSQLVYRVAAPVASAFSITNNAGASYKLAFAAILANVTDANGYTLSLTSVDSTTAGGKALALDGASVGTSTMVIIPASVADGDTFSYAVSDGHGGTGTGTVTVRVIDAVGQAQSIAVTGGQAKVSFAGIPGYTYEVQRADDADFTVNVVVLETTTVPANGSFSFTDNTATGPTGFYRLVYVYSGGGGPSPTVVLHP
jgi:fibronectin-binding autotransporter adhesin